MAKSVGFYLLAIAALLAVISGPAFAAPPVVKTVRVLDANPAYPHDVISGVQTRLKGTSDVSGAGIYYEWNFGDGSPAALGTVSNPYVIEATHTYTAPVGTAFIAKLKVTNTGTGESTTANYNILIQPDVLATRVNIAIDEGLWYLHKDMRRLADNKGDWVSSAGYGGYASRCYVAVTAANLNAFFVNGHLETSSPDNPYTETVKRGMRRLFEGLRTISIGVQTYADPLIGTVNPDTNGNGIGVEAYSGPSSFCGTDPPYQGGMIMDAIIASGSPDAVTTTGGAGIVGRTYKDIVQDMVDAYAYGQGDQGTYYGGWRYGWNYGCNNCNSDNSVNQWAAIGMIAAERVKGVGPDGISGTSDDVTWAIVPSWVKTANINSVNTTQVTSGAYNGYFAYSPTDYGFNPPGGWSRWATTPSGLVQMAMDGIGRADARWDRTENYMRNNFCNVGSSGSSPKSYYYGLFSLTKAMLLHDSNGDGVAESLQFLSNQPGNLNGIDWYAAQASLGAPCDGVARTLVNDQNASGYWYGHDNHSDQYYFETAWAVIMLRRTVVENPPIAVATAVPNPTLAGIPVTFDGSASYSTAPGKMVVKWEWDLDNNGTFEALGVSVSRTFASNGTYPVTLKVTDNGTPPLEDTDTINIVVMNPPVPPTADAGGPYYFCVNSTAPMFLNGTGSVNPDEGYSEPGKPPNTIISYEWDLNGDSVFGDVTGTAPNVTGLFPVGTYLIQLKVTDNSAASHPSFTQVNLSDTDAAMVIMRAATDPACSGGCTSDLAARAKPTTVDLTWSWKAGVNHYNVYRGVTNGGPYSKIAQVSTQGLPGKGVYADFGLINGTTYYYVVREAAANNDELCQSNQASAKPMAR